MLCSLRRRILLRHRLPTGMVWRRARWGCQFPVLERILCVCYSCTTTVFPCKGQGSEFRSCPRWSGRDLHKLFALELSAACRTARTQALYRRLCHQVARPLSLRFLWVFSTAHVRCQVPKCKARKRYLQRTCARG